MVIKDLLPFIVPGIFIQVFIQAYYIKHCWENNKLSQREKALFIGGIAIFNIIAAAVYLFFTRKKEVEAKISKKIEIDSNIRQGIFVLLLVAFEIFTLRVIIENVGSEAYTTIIMLLTTCFILMIINGLFVKRQHTLFYFLLPALQIICIIFAVYLDKAQNLEFLVLVVLAHIINKYSLKEAKFYSLVLFLLYISTIVIKMILLTVTINQNEFFSTIYVNFVVFVLVFLAFYTLKKQLISNAQLHEALKTLKEQSIKLEEMGAITERNIITGEIHDTVGHTLTTAIISIEAGQKLMDVDLPLARDKFTLAGEQIKRGLSDIRSSVKMIQHRKNMDFLSELKYLLSEICKNTNMKVTEIIEIQTPLLPIQQRILLHAIKECATNSLRHGGSTEADVLIQEYKDTLCLTFSDNGVSNGEINYGFGLNNMRERVESIGGCLQTQSIPGEGFMVTITIPISKDQGGNND